MRTGLTEAKGNRYLFDGQSSIFEVQTHNTDLKKRLSFRLTAPYSEERGIQTGKS